MFDAFIDSMDRPWRVFAFFIGLGASFILIDAAYLVIVTGSDLSSAIFSPSQYDLFTRVIVLVFGVLAAIVGELVLTRYRRTARELRTEQERLQTLYDKNPSAVLTLDRDFSVTYVNSQVGSIVGSHADKLVGLPCYQGIVGRDEPCEGCLVPQVFETGIPHSRIKHEITAAGRENWISQVWYPLTDAEGAIESVVEIASDVSALKLDPLTSLPNRVLLRDRLDVALASARRHGQSLAVMFLDIDGFKQINDRLGHAAGDALLTGIAERLRGVVRQDETLARISGDEFVLLIPTLETREDAEAIAVRVLEQLHTPFMLNGRPVPATVSIGICTYQGGDISAEAILDSADSAMYDAKAGGGNAFKTSTCGQRTHD